MWMQEEFNMSALKISPTLLWERQEKDDKEMLASEQRVYRQLVGKLLAQVRAPFFAASSRKITLTCPAVFAASTAYNNFFH